MAKYIGHTIESCVVVREVDVPDEFEGDAFREARHAASMGCGKVIDDAPANGPITPFNWESWDCERAE